MGDTSADPSARLELQLDHLRSDDRLRELAAAADPDPERRLEQAFAMSLAAAADLAGLGEESRRRLSASRESLGPGAEQVLRRLAGLGDAVQPGRGGPPASDPR